MPMRIGGVLGAASASPPDAKIAGNQAAIARNFASDRLEEIEAPDVLVKSVTTEGVALILTEGNGADRQRRGDGVPLHLNR